MAEKKEHWKVRQKREREEALALIETVEIAEEVPPVVTPVVEKVEKPILHKNRKVSRPFLVYDKDEGLRCQLRTEEEAIASVKLNGGFYINANL